jgi:hypothetical protein
VSIVQYEPTCLRVPLFNTGEHGSFRRAPAVHPPDVHLGRRKHRAAEAAHRPPQRSPRRALAPPAVQLRRRHRADLDVQRPLPASAVPGGRGRVPLLLRRRPGPPPPAGRRGVLRRVHLRLPPGAAGAGAPVRSRAGGGGGGDPGCDPWHGGGPGRRLGFRDGCLQDPQEPVLQCFGVDGFQAVRGRRLRVGQAAADGAGEDEPGRPGGAGPRQRRRGGAGVGGHAPARAHGRVQVRVPQANC